MQDRQSLVSVHDETGSRSSDALVQSDQNSAKKSFNGKRTMNFYSPFEKQIVGRKMEKHLHLPPQVSEAMNSRINTGCAQSNTWSSKIKLNDGTQKHL